MGSSGKEDTEGVISACQGQSNKKMNESNPKEPVSQALHQGPSALLLGAMSKAQGAAPGPSPMLLGAIHKAWSSPCLPIQVDQVAANKVPPACPTAAVESQASCTSRENHDTDKDPLEEIRQKSDADKDHEVPEEEYKELRRFLVRTLSENNIQSRSHKERSSGHQQCHNPALHPNSQQRSGHHQCHNPALHPNSQQQCNDGSGRYQQRLQSISESRQAWKARGGDGPVTVVVPETRSTWKDVLTKNISDSSSSQSSSHWAGTQRKGNAEELRQESMILAHGSSSRNNERIQKKIQSSSHWTGAQRKDNAEDLRQDSMSRAHAHPVETMGEWRWKTVEATRHSGNSSGKQQETVENNKWKTVGNNKKQSKQWKQTMADDQDDESVQQKQTMVDDQDEESMGDLDGVTEDTYQSMQRFLKKHQVTEHEASSHSSASCAPNKSKKEQEESLGDLDGLSDNEYQSLSRFLRNQNEVQTAEVDELDDITEANSENGEDAKEPESEFMSPVCLESNTVECNITNVMPEFLFRDPSHGPSTAGYKVGLLNGATPTASQVRPTALDETLADDAVPEDTYSRAGRDDGVSINAVVDLDEDAMGDMDGLSDETYRDLQRFLAKSQGTSAFPSGLCALDTSLDSNKDEDDVEDVSLIAPASSSATGVCSKNVDFLGVCFGIPTDGGVQLPETADNAEDEGEELEHAEEEEEVDLGDTEGLSDEELKAMQRFLKNPSATTSIGFMPQGSVAPFMALCDSKLNEALEAFGLSSDDLLLDLGCGDGKILCAAAERFGCRTHGVELDKGLVERAQERINDMPDTCNGLVSVEHGDLLEVDYKEMPTCVTMYLLPQYYWKLYPLLESFLSSGARLVVFTWELRGDYWASKVVKHGSPVDNQPSWWMYSFEGSID